MAARERQPEGERESRVLSEFISLRLLLLSLHRRYRWRKRSSQSTPFSRIIEYEIRRIEHPEGSCSFPYLNFVIFEFNIRYNWFGFVFILSEIHLSICVWFVSACLFIGETRVPAPFLTFTDHSTPISPRSLHTDFSRSLHTDLSSKRIQVCPNLLIRVSCFWLGN